MTEDKVIEIIESLQELAEDTTVPKNVKTKVENVINILKEEEELPIRVDKALQEMEDVSNDNNTQSYTRAQLWNIVSLLESMQLIF